MQNADFFFLSNAERDVQPQQIIQVWKCRNNTLRLQDGHLIQVLL